MTKSGILLLQKRRQAPRERFCRRLRAGASAFRRHCSSAMALSGQRAALPSPPQQVLVEFGCVGSGRSCVFEPSKTHMKDRGEGQGS